LTGLVLIHGFTGSPASFDELSRRLARRSARVSVHRPALLGHGGLAPGNSVRFEQEVDRIARGIVRAGASGSHVCGYSLGARIALGLLARHGHLFAGATLIGVHPGLSSLAERAARVGSDERWCELLSRRGVDAFLDAWQAQPLFATQRALPAARAAEQRRVRSSHSAQGLMHALRVLGLGQMPDYRSALGSARCRLRLVAGERDDKFAGLAREMAGRSPSIELDLVPGVGHNVLLEAPDHLERSLLRELARAGAVRREELQHEN
jgi:2-succinyl-6-hydroxy-2,4-cyclohexadiene-1-carboxylate synthase